MPPVSELQVDDNAPGEHDEPIMGHSENTIRKFSFFMKAYLETDFGVYVSFGRK
jgi:hypothetical protein